MPSTRWADLWLALELFQDAILCAAIGGAVLGFLSVYIVLRRMVFVSAAVTQSAGLGVALAFYAQIHLALEVDPVVGATLLALSTTLLLTADLERLHLSRESVLGLAFAASGGAAVLVGAAIAQEAHDIQSILFGTAVMVRHADLVLVSVTGALVAALHLWWWRGLTFASFDPVSARVQRLPVRLLSAVVLLSIGLMVGVCARALGALPVFALSTTPALAALVAGAGLRASFVLGALLGAATGAGGYVAAYLFDLPVGASQTVFAVATVAIAIAVRGIRSLGPVSTRYTRT